ncbi:TetR/AcrR family transcriptional regulator [Rhodococcus sp. WS3]|uniref:TetR/AcrR family transcriptional regulator n=1 Tax=Rhodococcus sp. WS3 TaxID=2486271 RepID=UPI0016512259|nr:TetR/AcrR family transcriptional regulator [Rhodococcus sp. WS3]
MHTASTEHVGTKGQQTEQLIKAAARTVFKRDGYLNARMTDIADEAGKSPGTLYNYFDNKREILHAMLEDFLNRVLADGNPDPQGVYTSESLRSAVAVFWRTYTEFIPELVGITHAAAVEDEFLQAWMQIRGVGVRQIAGRIKVLQREGITDPSVDPYVAASALSSMLEHSCYLWLGMNAQGIGRPKSDDEAIDTITYLWSRALGIE